VEPIERELSGSAGQVEGAGERRKPCLVAVDGELSLATVNPVWRDMRGALESGAPLVLDLSRCWFIDSTGLAIIIRVARELGQRGNFLSIFGCDGQPRSLFELTRVLDSNKIRVFPNEEAARSAVVV
jgi:anti-anti-sigma factor